MCKARWVRNLSTVANALYVEGTHNAEPSHKSSVVVSDQSLLCSDPAVCVVSAQQDRTIE